MRKALFIFTVVITMSIQSIYGQDADSESHNLTISFPQVALLDIESENGTEVNFAINSSGLEAGEELIIHEEQSELWLNYTSLVASNGTQRSITVESSPLPDIPGLVISLIAMSHSGTGGGDLGAPTPVIIPSSSPTNIITGIGSAFTGDGSANGHQLIYYLDFNGNFEDLNVQNGSSTTISLTYTITD